MELVRVTNTRPALLHLPDRLEKVAGGKDEQGRPIDIRITGYDTGKSLLPGGNNVAREEWERAKAHKVVQGWLRMGWLTEGGDTSQPEGPEVPKELSSYGVSTAIALADGEDNPITLREWLKAEARPEVQAALKKRIEAVGVGGATKARGRT